MAGFDSAGDLTPFSSIDIRFIFGIFSGRNEGSYSDPCVQASDANTAATQKLDRRKVHGNFTTLPTSLLSDFFWKHQGV